MTPEIPIPQETIDAAAHAVVRADGGYPPVEEPDREETLKEAARLAEAAIRAFLEAEGMRVEREGFRGKAVPKGTAPLRPEPTHYRLVSGWKPINEH